MVNMLKYEKGFMYLEEEECITIVGYVGDNVGDVVIPGEISGKPVTKIGCKEREFYSYPHSYILPDSIEYIDLDAMIFGTSKDWFYRVQINDTNPYFAMADACLYTKDMKKLIHSSNNTLKTLILPEGLEEICPYAFDSECLEKVYFPKSLKIIGSGAFFNSAIKEIMIPQTIEHIGDAAFNRFTTVIIEGSNTIIGTEVAGTIKIGDSNKGMIIENEMLMTADKTRIIRYLGNAKEIVIPESVKEIDKAAFSGRGIKKLKLNPGLEKIGEYAFRPSKISNVKIPNSVKDFAPNTFNHDQPVTKIVWEKDNENFREDGTALYRRYPDGTEDIVEIIDKSITEFIVPQSVKRIKNKLFSDCTKLKKLILHEGMESFSALCTYGGNCGLSEVYIPASISSIDTYKPFSNLKYKVSEDNPCYFIDDNVLYQINGDNDYTLLCCQDSNIRFLEIAEGTTFIAPFAFSDYAGVQCTSLEKVILPSTLKSIGEHAFYGTGLKALDIPDGTEYIEAQAFSSCNNLEQIKIPNSLKWIAVDAFAFCQSLKEVPSL